MHSLTSQCLRPCLGQWSLLPPGAAAAPAQPAAPPPALASLPPCSNLMAKQDLRDLGFAEGDAPAPAQQPKEKKEKRRLETEGYLAGMKRFEDDQQ